MANVAFQLVVAATKGDGIGKDGTLPWNLPGDMSYFRRLTQQTASPSTQNVVIMGRKTWDSIPVAFRPLKGRFNIVLSRSATIDEDQSDGSGNLRDQAVKDLPTPIEKVSNKTAGVTTCKSLEDALALVASPEMSGKVESVFVIGGAQVYQEAIQHPGCAVIHLTRIETEQECDTFFPALDPAKFRFWSASQPVYEKEVQYSFLCYTTTNKSLEFKLPTAMASRHEEQQYLDLVDSIIKTGVFRPDRTGTGTFAKFGTSMRFDLRHSFPLLTTKRVFWRGLVEELLWFVKGCTNAKLLQDKGVHIWDGNSSREYLDSIGLTEREEGDLGPVYGFQWRHFGASYTDMHADYTGQGVDQLADVIRRIKENPNDRRILLSAWNPSDLGIMALPPCHMFSQFFVADGVLSCLMYQRSCDVGLGVPFNIASYALLTIMIAQVCGLKAGEFVHMMGDTHVYANHVDPLKEQLKNEPHHFPTLKVNPEKKDIDSFEFSDFELIGYTCHKKIEMKMAV